jgi:hypothetical protein
MHYQIEYGLNHGDKFTIQVNFHHARRIVFYNWTWEDITPIANNSIVAIWRVKRLKTKAIIDIPPFLIENN